MKIFVTYFFALLFAFTFVSACASSVFAQSSSIVIATYVPLADENVLNGLIVSNTNSGYSLSKSEYDNDMYGVIVLNPAIVLNEATTSGSFPVANTGDVDVIVSNSNGQIKRGDYITSSRVAGVGMKATRSGHVIGVAISDLGITDENGRAIIRVSLRSQNYIAPSNLFGNITDLSQLATLAAYQQPLQVLRYVIAGIILVLCVLVAFFHFGRITASSIEALGRNPLAGKSIQIGIFFNLIMAIVLLGSGLGLSILILRM